MIKPNIAAIIKDKIKRTKSGSNDIYVVGPVKLPVELDGETKTFHWYSWLRKEAGEELSVEQLLEDLNRSSYADMQQSSVLVYGDFENSDDSLIRMHSICHTGDIFGSARCDCGYQLKQSMRIITEHGSGALFYLANHEGRGIGLFSKAIAYLLQEDGLDTVDANTELGFEDDTRDYSDAIAVLKLLRTRSGSIITNNPRKVDALGKAGMNVTGRVPLWGQSSVYNEKYLQTKVKRSGHFGQKPESIVQ
ncbi:GTP cyclohydrolase II [Paenibacillus sp. sgz302251]|uniref:GTP cyclohydrolase II n=1 Tax=Paenibacillus sp. sgz302251 TaxID=3414493 RepID=UPI003C7A1CA5